MILMMMQKIKFISIEIYPCIILQTYQIFVMTPGTVTLEVILLHQHPPSLSCGIQLINVTDEHLQDTYTRN